MKYLIVLFLLLGGCGFNITPDTTTLEMGETSNGKEKSSKSIKQTWKWGKK
tara:strand:+ start:735 stop:887 length:153 start_codon:yes stop_codon:yes gene_type:complete